MTKSDRAALIRARFAERYPSKMWVNRACPERKQKPEPKRKPARPHYNAIRLTPYNDRIRFPGDFGGNREGKITDWTFQPDTKQRMAIIATEGSDRASVMTRIAEKIYQHNRMAWRKGATS